MTNPCILSENTMEALASFHKNVCWTTTYMRNYCDPHTAKIQDLSETSSDGPSSKHVTFSDLVEHLDSTSHENEELDKTQDKISDNEASAKEDVEQASAVSCDENIADDEKICRFCCKKIRKIGDVKFLRENGKLEPSALSNVIEDKSAISTSDFPTQKRLAWPIDNRNLRDLKPNYPKLIINGYNDKRNCQKISSLFCRCEQYPGLKESILREEAVAKRRSSSFAKRNHTTISVFRLLKYDADAAQGKLRQKPRASDTILNQPRIMGWDPGYKSEAIREFHGRYPEGVSGMKQVENN